MNPLFIVIGFGVLYLAVFIYSYIYRVPLKGELHGMKFNTILRKNLPAGVKWGLDEYCDDPTECSVENLPDRFDCREKWPYYITHPLNQEKCGSCWAFATTTAISDRIRIHSQIGTHKIEFQDTKWKEEVLDSTSSKPLMDIVQYKDGSGLDNISPYTFAGCDICELAEKMDPAIKDYFGGQVCNQCCDGGVIQYAYIYSMFNGCISIAGDDEPWDYTCSDYGGTPKYRVKAVYHLDQGEKQIMASIYHKGPVVCGFAVMDTFGTPKGKIPGTDIFKEVGTPVGGHAVCITGWGEDVDAYGTKVKYWLCRNSWGRTWNGDGYFKIERGTNCCGIEEDVWGCTPFEVYDLTPGPRTERPAQLNTCEHQDSGGVVNPE